MRLEYTVAPGVPGCASEAMFRKLVMIDAEGEDPFASAGPATHVLRVGFASDPPGVRVTVELLDAEGHSLRKRQHVERDCVDAGDRGAIEATFAVYPPPPAPASAADLKELVDRVTAQGATIAAHDAALKAQRERIQAQDEKIEALTARMAGLQEALEKAKKKMDLSFALSTGALITANLTSNVGPGVWFGAEGRVGPISLGLEARALLPSPVRVGPYDLDLSQFGGLLVPCGRYSYFFGCVVAGAGAQYVQDSNYAPPGDPLNPTFWDSFLSVGGRVGVEVPLGDSPFAARGWAEVLYTKPLWDFKYVETGDHWTRPDVSAFFGVGIVLKLEKDGER